jgi:oxygen-independent coproporphyrinogen-3 oxidase
VSLLASAPALPTALYVHVPFCARRCSYCDFAVHAARLPPTQAWLEAIAAELALQSQAHGWGEPLPLRTLYVGGGTPSLLGPGAMGALASRVGRYADLGAMVEWSCEANPESFDAALAADWREAGVNRVSLGVQSFHAPALRWMGRLHGPDGSGRAVLAARAAGIDDLSVDLIFGLPERLGRSWADDLERALELEPTHISLYGLTAEEGAPLGRWVRERGERLADEERYADEYLLAHERLVGAGWEHYEVSNFARPGHASRHNAVYWSGAAYAALGPGAHAFLPPRRVWNLRGWDAYREAVRAGVLPVEGEEEIGVDDARLERCWLALRTRSGLPARELSPAQRRLAAAWARQGWAAEETGMLRLSAEGWLLLDQLASDLAAAAESAATAA